MIVALECRTPCPVCGYLLACHAFPSVRVNKGSLKVLPGLFVRTNPGTCPECGFRSWPVPLLPNSFTASPWALEPRSAAKVDAYRAQRWGDT